MDLAGWFDPREMNHTWTPQARGKHGWGGDGEFPRRFSQIGADLWSFNRSGVEGGSKLERPLLRGQRESAGIPENESP